MCNGENQEHIHCQKPVLCGMSPELCPLKCILQKEDGHIVISLGDALSVMVTIVGNRIGNPNSNIGGCLHFTLC